MADEAVLPLPNDRFGESTVVASIWLRDDVTPPFALVLLLGEDTPYYTVSQIEWRDGIWHHVHAEHHENIVPAVEAYQQNGGDY